MADEVKRCEICGRPKGDYHRRPVAGECTAPDPTDYTVSIQCLSIALRNTQEALAAARRECEDLKARLKAIEELFAKTNQTGQLEAMRRELAEGREIVRAYHKHITGSTKPDPDCDECSEIREWLGLAAPAAGEEGT